MCCRRRDARRAARRSCGSRNAALGHVYEPRQGLIRQIVNHIIEHREQKHALARGDFIQPRALEEGNQAMRIGRGVQQSEQVDEKQDMRFENLGMGVDRVGGRSIELPTYREALKN